MINDDIIIENVSHNNQSTIYINNYKRNQALCKLI